MDTKTIQRPIPTELTELLGCQYPIIAGPMFLVSDTLLVSEVSEAGAIGGMPSLNWRTTEQFREAVREVKRRTSKPYAVNLIVNKANPRVDADLQVCVEERVPLIITSLGSPAETIKRMHEVGSKVVCDVTTLDYAKKVEAMGADGVIAVASGAGGHAGPVSAMVLIPYLRKHLRIPVIAAGGISNGQQMAASLMLGASAVSVGTRFIASLEAKVDDAYKNAILNAEPDDIVLTHKISGTPLSVINTPYVQSQGLDVNRVERFLLTNPTTKRYMKMLRVYIGSEQLKTAVLGPTYKEIWSAGQGVGLIEDVLPARDIVHRLVREYYEAAGAFALQSGFGGAESGTESATGSNQGNGNGAKKPRGSQASQAN